MGDICGEFREETFIFYPQKNENIRAANENLTEF